MEQKNLRWIPRQMHRYSTNKIILHTLRYTLRLHHDRILLINNYFKHKFRPHRVWVGQCLKVLVAFLDTQVPYLCPIAQLVLRLYSEEQRILGCLFALLKRIFHPSRSHHYTCNSWNRRTLSENKCVISTQRYCRFRLWGHYSSPISGANKPVKEQTCSNLPLGYNLLVSELLYKFSSLTEKEKPPPFVCEVFTEYTAGSTSSWWV